MFQGQRNRPRLLAFAAGLIGAGAGILLGLAAIGTWVVTGFVTAGALHYWAKR